MHVYFHQDMYHLKMRKYCMYSVDAMHMEHSSNKKETSIKSLDQETIINHHQKHSTYQMENI